MRITAHTAIAPAPVRTSPTRLPTHAPARAPATSPPPVAVKPTFQTTVPVTSTDPFASLFQAFTLKAGSSSTQSSTSATTTPRVASIFTPSATTGSGATATTATPSTSASATASVPPTGIQALVSAILSGTFQPTYVTDPSQLKEIYPLGTDYEPSGYFVSDQTASQLAQLLGGTVVKMPPFGQDKGWTEPNANFIQLPNGQTFNAADVAYYSRCALAGGAQLTSDLTATINMGAQWTNWYQHGGALPTFPEGYVGPPISGMTYAPGSIGADGNVINPAG